MTNTPLNETNRVEGEYQQKREGYREFFQLLRQYFCDYLADYFRKTAGTVNQIYEFPIYLIRLPLPLLTKQMIGSMSIYAGLLTSFGFNYSFKSLLDDILSIACQTFRETFPFLDVNRYERLFREYFESMEIQPFMNRKFDEGRSDGEGIVLKMFNEYQAAAAKSSSVE